MIKAIGLVGLLMGLAGPSYASGIAIGDSLALGFGRASGMNTSARVGISSCMIRGYVPSRHYDTVLISAGTNDVPGKCVGQIRQLVANRVHPSRVYWIIPVNQSRGNVLRVSAQWGDTSVFYVASRRRAVWPHPDHYYNVIK